jgi:glutathione synthase/RimK-type ligase-like ATP-grasp enzyme
VRIALVTGSDGPSFMHEVDLPLVDALEARGVEVDRPVWHDPAVDWAAFDLALVRTTWDYPARRDEFVAWAHRAGTATVLHNPPEVLRWNTHKSYLLELEERGAPVVPTAWLGRGDRVALGELLTVRGWARAVLKPAVASGSDGLLRVTTLPSRGSGSEVIEGAGEADLGTAQAHLDELLQAGDVLVQPFLESVETRGELSVIVVDGRVSHAVRKTPPTGEYRIQEQFGGRYVVETVDAQVAALAEWIVEATGTALLVARVDLLEDASGTPQLAELEATEPDLYLNVVPEAADRLAAALVAAAADDGVARART